MSIAFAAIVLSVIGLFGVALISLSKKSTAVSSRSGPLRILPLGNSITQADRYRRSYRYNLWLKLIDAGIDFDLVGSINSNHKGNPIWPDYKGHSFDSDHEGHYGWRADEIVNGAGGKSNKLSEWLKDYTPDIVLMHLGTNDICQHQDSSTTADELKQIIEVLRADNPNVIILLSNLIPIRDRILNVLVVDFNIRINTIAKEMDTMDSPVFVVDQYGGFDAELDSYDKLHPNERGEEKMASKWFQSMQEILR
jgi:hypothetical protein